MDIGEVVNEIDKVVEAIEGETKKLDGKGVNYDFSRVYLHLSQIAKLVQK